MSGLLRMYVYGDAAALNQLKKQASNVTDTPAGSNGKEAANTMAVVSVDAAFELICDYIQSQDDPTLRLSAPCCGINPLPYVLINPNDLINPNVLIRRVRVASSVIPASHARSWGS
jgi:hypothetical protein